MNTAIGLLGSLLFAWSAGTLYLIAVHRGGRFDADPEADVLDDQTYQREFGED